MVKEEETVDGSGKERCMTSSVIGELEREVWPMRVGRCKVGAWLAIVEVLEAKEGSTSRSEARLVQDEDERVLLR
jgi:hypothetical protein